MPAKDGTGPIWSKHQARGVDPCNHTGRIGHCRDHQHARGRFRDCRCLFDPAAESGRTVCRYSLNELQQRRDDLTRELAWLEERIGEIRSNVDENSDPGN